MSTVLIIVLTVLVISVVVFVFALCKSTAARERAFQETWESDRK